MDVASYEADKNCKSRF